MSRATRSALIIATGTLAGSSAGFGVWQVTGFQAVWFSLLLDVAGVLGVAGLVDWRRKWCGRRSMRAGRAMAAGLIEGIANPRPLTPGELAHLLGHAECASRWLRTDHDDPGQP